MMHKGSLDVVEDEISKEEVNDYYRKKSNNRLKNSEYSRMLKVMDSLYAYAYSVSGDFIYKGYDKTEKVHHSMVFRVDKSKLIATVRTKKIINDGSSIWEESFYSNNSRYISINKKPFVLDKTYSTQEYAKLFQCGGELDLFDFQTWTTYNMQTEYLCNGILFENIGFSPKSSDEANIKPEFVDVKSSYKNVFVNPKTYIIELIKGSVKFDYIIDGSRESVYGNHLMSLLDIDNQVFITIPDLHWKKDSKENIIFAIFFIVNSLVFHLLLDYEYECYNLRSILSL